MKQVLKLNHPIKIGDKTYQELAYDADEITVDAFAEANRVRTVEASRAGGLSMLIEGDNQMHVYLGFQAIRALNPGLGFGDLYALHGGDIIAVMNIGRNFILGSGESGPGSSEEPSENTPESSIQALPISKNGG